MFFFFSIPISDKNWTDLHKFFEKFPVRTRGYCSKKSKISSLLRPSFNRNKNTNILPRFIKNESWVLLKKHGKVPLVASKKCSISNICFHLYQLLSDKDTLIQSISTPKLFNFSRTLTKSSLISPTKRAMQHVTNLIMVGSVLNPQITRTRTRTSSRAHS